MPKKTEIFNPPSDKQYLIFINELENDVDFFEQHRVCNSGLLWQRVVDKMNEEVGPKKNVEEWRLVLKRLKYSVRQKYRAVDPNIPGALSNFSEVQQKLLLALGQLDVNSCRSCNTKNSDDAILYPLFEDMNTLATLTEKAKIYTKITHFQILKSDMLPRWLCSECWKQCEDWHNFLKNCAGFDDEEYKVSLDKNNKNMVETKEVKPLKRYGGKKKSTSKSKRKTNKISATSQTNQDIEEFLINHDSEDMSNSSHSMGNDSHSVDNDFKKIYAMENDYHDSNEIDLLNSDPFETIFIKEESADQFEFPGLKLTTLNKSDPQFSDQPTLGFAVEIKKEEIDEEDDMIHDSVFVMDGNNDSVDHDDKKFVEENLTNIKDFKKEPIKIKIETKKKNQKKGTDKFTCEFCNHTFARKETILNHLLVHVKSAMINEQYLNKKYECFLCGTPFEELTKLRIHMLIHSPNIRKHICQLCGAAFRSAYMLRNHSQRHESTSRRTCLDCGKVFVSPDHLGQHNKRFMGKPCHPSLHVKFGFKSEFPKVKEVKNVLPVIHSCQLCNKIFKTRKSLTDHGYSSHRKWEKKYLCAQCGKSFIKPNLLLTHQRTHDPSAALYPCTKCNKQFSTPPLLRAHLKTHLDHRPHVCTICSKSFKTSNHLRTHNRVHTGVRPFSCDICHMTFAYLDVLKRHKNKHADMEY